MSEIYWISRLDAILTVLGCLCSISGIVLVCMGIMSLVDREDDLMPKEVKKKAVRHSSLMLIIVIPILTFVPSSKDAMAIWGIGPTLDYIQDNESFEELPDKCVKALEAWVESLNEDQ
jgi:hypothetical protein